MGIEIHPLGVTKIQLLEANIPIDYWDCDFSNYRGPKEARSQTVRYLKRLETMHEKGIGLMYVGPNGSGKTTLAMIAMKYLVRARWRVYATSLGELVENIQKSWKDSVSDNDEHLSIERARECDFLFIDDAGKEHRGQSGFVQTVFDNLIRHRVQHRLPTFLTTNLTKSELTDTYGESFISLLEGKLYPCVVNGRDIRSTELKREVKESFK